METLAQKCLNASGSCSDHSTVMLGSGDGPML